MGIKRIVDTSFWTDGKVDDFSPEDKYFMMYLLTTPYTTQLGIYKVSMKYMAIHLGYSEDSVKVLLERFEKKYGIIIFSKETSEIAIKNYLRHSIIKGGAPVRDCLIKEMKAVKNKELIATVFAHIKNYEDLNETVKKIILEYEEKNGELHYCNEKENDNDNDNDNENEVSYHVSSNVSSNDSLKVNSPAKAEPHKSHSHYYKEIIDYLNEKANTNYRHNTKATQGLIKARLNEGFTIDDFKKVIDNKCAEWLNEPKMIMYLRPQTLFGNKFESYLNAKTIEKTNTNFNSSKVSETTKKQVQEYERQIREESEHVVEDFSLYEGLL